ncbi:hypothetical protein Aph01nite_44210 [Acrocarpospora phusangensis]|uniref:Protein kinase domain-containing protein n=1 Tax=Acrocarpospora phusangensis TaxID=1070424 RepID=A0A919QC52_9ACTN|nr:serine/threonine-protein kinase [Acrocarpospora phusangensis]GIH26111.1 hypothetical protein Aph01nite_44210 [Acrocarpospora phusangensis]
MVAPGDWRVPGYAEVRTLGVGGGGRVVLAVHEASGAHVAIKYLSEDLRGQPGFLDGFRAEARLLIEVDDPHVVKLYEYVQTPGGAAIVMELINGAPLRALLRAEGGTGPEAALAVLKGSLLGLAAAHERGVVHRDYKPDNVIVRADGSSKLVDFGIAVRSGAGAAAAGTPAYMSPEQWAGHPASPATDVYAATAVFFECLTGRRPYQATEHVVLMHMHQTAPVPSGDVPVPVRRLVERGLAKDPLSRPASAAMFVAELEETAVAAYGPDWEEKGRRRLAALAGLAAGLFPMGGGTVPQVGTTLFKSTLGAFGRSLLGKVVIAGAALVVAGSAITAYALGADGEPVRDVVPLVADELPTPPVTETPSETPAETPAGTPTPEPAETPTETPTETPGETPAETPTAAPPETPEPDPTPPAAAPTKVLGVAVSGLSLAASATAPVAKGTVSVVTDGVAKTTLTVKFTVNGKVVGTRTMALSGAKKYTKSVSRDLGTRPCTGTWGIVATTSPAAASGAITATAKVPACPTGVTGLDVQSLTIDKAGRSATATVRVRTDGTGRIELNGDFRGGGQSSDLQALRLSGQTEYTRTFSYTFPKAVCSGSVAFAATSDPAASSGGAKREVKAACDPPKVTDLTVSVGNQSQGSATITSTVTVRTDGPGPVTLTTTYLRGDDTVNTQTFTLSGETSYQVTVTHDYGRLCDTYYSLRAQTVPAFGRAGALDRKLTRYCANN